MKLRKILNLPREHGAWAMLYVPFVLGVLTAGGVTPAALLLLASASAMFISRESLLAWWRARARGRESGSAGRLLATWLGLAALFGAPLIVVYHLWLLIPLALVGTALLAINGKQALELEDRSIRSEVLAISAMTLTAPAAYYVIRGVWDQTAFWLWGLSVLFFSSSVFYIKLRILNLNRRRQERRRQVWQHCALYHGFLLAALLTLAVTGRLHLFTVIAFAPVMARTFLTLIRPPAQVNLKRAGLLELAWSLVFLVFTTLTFRPV
ncbi:MAG TPA: YwiC-like family protein [Blastocatellia bacterium]|nr:YwiC-like family protein [Blastocatellia bacterium]